MKSIFPIALVIVAGILGYAWYTHTPKAYVPRPITTGTTATTTVSVVMKTYTFAEVATHNAPTNCWTTIRGGVYDLTEWIGKHPGGEQAILGTCGIDATAMFEKQHGGSPKPEAMLATFKIGDLAK